MKTFVTLLALFLLGAYAMPAWHLATSKDMTQSASNIDTNIPNWNEDFSADGILAVTDEVFMDEITDGRAKRNFLPPAPTPFQAYSSWQTPFTSSGAVTLYTSIPGVGPVAPIVTLPATIAADPANQRYAYLFTGVTNQWTLANGTYSQIPPLAGNTCFFCPFTYANEVLAYKNALFTGRALYAEGLDVVDVYEGQVNDALSCGGPISVNIGVRRRDNIPARLSFSQSAPASSTNGTCSSPLIGVVKSAGVAIFDNLKAGTPNSSLFTLPPECATPTPYCGPSGDFCYPCAAI